MPPTLGLISTCVFLSRFYSSQGFLSEPFQALYVFLRVIRDPMAQNHELLRFVAFSGFTTTGFYVLFGIPWLETSIYHVYAGFLGFETMCFIVLRVFGAPWSCRFGGSRAE